MSKLAQEAPGQTLQATALVHEAYVRLAGGDTSQTWDGQRHFFAAAAEAMRRILVENARRKGAGKHGGGRQRLDVDRIELGASDADPAAGDVLALDEALTAFAAEFPKKADLVRLRYFAGLSIEQAAETLEISPATAKRQWAFARAWLFRAIEGNGREPSP